LEALTSIKQLINWLLPSYGYAIRKYYSIYSIRREPEPREFAVLRHLIRDGYLVVDAGANLGVYTKFFAEYGPHSYVLSFEPIPMTFELLRANVEALELHNVRILQCALSDRSKSVIMEIPQAARGLPNYYLARIKYSDASVAPIGMHVTVQTYTLDEVLAKNEARVCLIKADVEMHELELLRGAQIVLHRDHPAIYLEIQPNFASKRSQLEEIIDLLAVESYSPYYLNAGRLMLWTGGAHTALDFFFLTSDHVRELDRHGIGIAE
jgi:FkbM family methyltransferase